MARQSQTILTMLDDLSIKELKQTRDGKHTIPLFKEELTGPVFKKMLVWMEENQGKPDFQKDNFDNELKKKEIDNGLNLNEWEKKYIEMPVDDMLTLMVCGNFLKIKGLINLMFKAIALQIQGKSKEELKETFTIRYSDSQDLKKLKDENAWVCEKYSNNILQILKFYKTMKGLYIETSDGETFKLDWVIAQQSPQIRRLLDDLMIEEDGDVENIIPIYNEKVTEITGPVFKKALVWMEENRGKPDFQEDDDGNELLKKEPVNWNEHLNEWEKQYIKMPDNDMLGLHICAEFLKIKGLIRLMIKAMDTAMVMEMN